MEQQLDYTETADASDATPDAPLEKKKKKERPDELVPLVNYLGNEVARIKRELDMEDEEAGLEAIGKDTFSFFLLATYPCPFKQDNLWDVEEETSVEKDKLCLPFWWASLVLITQVFVYSVVLSSSSPGFLADIPLGITKTLRVAQFFACFITLLTQNDFADGVKLFISREAIAKQVPTVKFYVSTGLRFFTGILGIYTTFLLVVRSDEAVDLLLNFSAMEFVAELDGVGYSLASSNFLGSTLQVKARQVEEMKYKRDRSGSRSARRFWKYMPYAVVGAFLLIAFSSVWAKQNGRYFEENKVYIQFDDESWSKLPKLSGVYEGHYHPRMGGKSVGNIKYVKLEEDVEKAPGFVYCRKASGTAGSWKFDDKGNTKDPCEGNNLKVASNIDGDEAKPSDEYNLLTHASAQWVYQAPRKTTKMSIIITEASELDSYKSLSNTPCEFLYLRQGDDLYWFNKTDSSKSSLEQLSQRPLFKSEFEFEGESLAAYIVFNGYRWILTIGISSEYDESSQVLDNLGPDDVWAVSNAFGFLTSNDLYLPTGNVVWSPSVGFLPDTGRVFDETIFTSCLNDDCGNDQRLLGITYWTDGYPAETFFTMFLDSFEWDPNADLIPVYGSTTFDFGQAPAFRGGPYPNAGELYSLFGCVDNQAILNIGFFDVIGDGVTDPWERAATGETRVGAFEIYVDGGDVPVFRLSDEFLGIDEDQQFFSCLMFELDASTATVTNTGGTFDEETGIAVCDTAQKELTEDTLINY